MDEPPCDIGTDELRQRGVLRFTLPVPWAQAESVNTYVLVGPPHVIVDPGYVDNWQRLCDETSTAGVDLDDAGLVLLTHGHLDHASAVEPLLRRVEAPVHLHPADAQKLAPRYLERKAEQYLRLRPWFVREGVPAAVFDDFVGRFRANRHRFASEVRVAPLRSGQRLCVGRRNVEVVGTPGHTPGHVVFRDADAGVVFSGDHLLARVSPNPILDFDERDRRVPSMPWYLVSLDRVNRLAADCWCPGHGPSFAAAGPVIDSLLGFLRRRQRTLLDLARGITSSEIAIQLFPDARGLDGFLAFSEVVGHVDVLLDRGELRATLEGGRRLLHEGGS